MSVVQTIQQITGGQKFLFRSPITQVNESSSEYVVSTMKHHYDNCVVIQYGIKNTLEDQVLSNLTLKIKGLQTEGGLSVQGAIGLADGDSVAYGDLKFVYLVLSKDNSVLYPTAKIKQAFNFTITEVDVDTQEEIGTYEDDYELPDVPLAVRDYLKGELLPSGQFKEVWE